MKGVYIAAFIVGFLCAVISHKSHDSKKSSRLATRAESSWLFVNFATKETNAVVLYFTEDGRVLWSAGTNGAEVAK